MLYNNSISGSVGFGLGDAVYNTDHIKIKGSININVSGPYHRADNDFFTASGLIATCNNVLEALVDLADHSIICGGYEIFQYMSSIAYKADIYSHGNVKDLHFADKNNASYRRKQASRLFYRTLNVVEQLWGDVSSYSNRFEYLYKLGVLTDTLVGDLEDYIFNVPSFEFTDGLEEDDELLDKCKQFIENSTLVYCDEYENYLGCGFRVSYINATAQYFGDNDDENGWVPFPETSPSIVGAYSDILNRANDAYYKIQVFADGSDSYNINKILGNKFGSDKYIEIF